MKSYQCLRCRYCHINLRDNRGEREREKMRYNCEELSLSGVKHSFSFSMCIICTAPSQVFINVWLFYFFFSIHSSRRCCFFSLWYTHVCEQTQFRLDYELIRIYWFVCRLVGMSFFKMGMHFTL